MPSKRLKVKELLPLKRAGRVMGCFFDKFLSSLIENVWALAAFIILLAVRSEISATVIYIYFCRKAFNIKLASNGSVAYGEAEVSGYGKRNSAYFTF
jgi:hypothetical protein